MYQYTFYDYKFCNFVNFGYVYKNKLTCSTQLVNLKLDGKSTCLATIVILDGMSTSWLRIKSLSAKLNEKFNGIYIIKSFPSVPPFCNFQTVVLRFYFAPLPVSSQNHLFYWLKTYYRNFIQNPTLFLSNYIKTNSKLFCCWKIHVGYNEIPSIWSSVRFSIWKIRDEMTKKKISKILKTEIETITIDTLTSPPPLSLPSTISPCS